MSLRHPVPHTQSKYLTHNFPKKFVCEVFCEEKKYLTHNQTTSYTIKIPHTQSQYLTHNQNTSHTIKTLHTQFFLDVWEKLCVRYFDCV